MGLAIKAINAFTNSSFVKKYVTGPKALGTIGTITLASMVSKDVINCAFYTWQSRTNKRIPDDQRNFVSAYDLVNGVVNTSLQIVSCFLFEKKIFPALYDKIIEPKFFPINLADKLRTKYPSLTFADAQKKIKTLKGVTKAGLIILGMLAVGQIIAKRVLAPFVSTPLASVVRKYFDKADGKLVDEPKNQPIQQDTVSFLNKNDDVKQENTNKKNNKTNITLVDNQVVVISQVNKNLPDCYKTFAK